MTWSKFFNVDISWQNQSLVCMTSSPFRDVKFSANIPTPRIMSDLIPVTDQVSVSWCRHFGTDIAPIYPVADLSGDSTSLR